MIRNDQRGISIPRRRHQDSIRRIAVKIIRQERALDGDFRRQLG
jgi:hypothetical protein